MIGLYIVEVERFFSITYQKNYESADEGGSDAGNV